MEVTYKKHTKISKTLNIYSNIYVIMKIALYIKI